MAFAEYLHSRHRRRNGRRARRDRSERRRPQEPAGARWGGSTHGRFQGPRASPESFTNGTAVIEWAGATTAVSPRFDVFATTGVVASGRTIPLVQGSGQAPLAGEGHHPRHNAVDMTAIANLGLDSNAGKPPRSAVVSSCERWIRPQSSAGATSASPHVRSIDCAAGALDVDATLEGTLGAVRAAGRIAGQSVTVAGCRGWISTRRLVWTWPE